MRLNEKTVKFTTTEGKTPNFEQTQNLKLVVNGKITEIGIEELFFLKPSINSGYLKGYSVLEQLKETSKGVFDSLEIGGENEPLTIGFTDPATGDMFYIKSMEIPALYYQNDFTDEDITNQLQKFYSPEAPASSTSTSSTSTPEGVTVDKSADTSADTKVLADEEVLEDKEEEPVNETK